MDNQMIQLSVTTLIYFMLLQCSNFTHIWYKY